MIATKESPTRVGSAAGMRISDLVARWKVGRRKVLAWIRSGRLPAINTASDKSSRPQYLILPEDVTTFERESLYGTEATATAKASRVHRGKVYV